MSSRDQRLLAALTKPLLRRYRYPTRSPGVGKPMLVSGASARALVARCAAHQETRELSSPPGNHESS